MPLSREILQSPLVKIVKIDQYLAKIWTKYNSLLALVFVHCVSIKKRVTFIF